MPELGYACLSEQHEPDEMVEYVAEAERRGFDYAMVSDHFHPWTTAQGESPFAWGVLGAIANETEEIGVGTAVTAPIIRIHPAIVAQAAATAACQFDGRFVLGVGTGERLNEHVTGERWPPHDVRLEMLEEAVEIMRLLWSGGEQTYRGEHFTVENARVFTLPEEPPPIAVAASGESTAAAAGHYGDALISTSPDEDVVERFEAGNEREVRSVSDSESDERSEPRAGESEPHVGQFHACYAETEEEGVETALETWPNAGMSGELGQELATPAHFEQAASMVDANDIADRVVCGSDPDDFVEKIDTFVDAGFERVHVHQIGQQQSEFLEFYESEVMASF